jgi:hypothetical protein
LAKLFRNKDKDAKFYFAKDANGFDDIFVMKI